MWNPLEQMLKTLNSNRYKYRTYLFINQPSTCLAIGYQVVLGLVTIACMALTIVLTHRETPFDHWLQLSFDLTVTIVLTVDVVVRVWASTCLPKYRAGWRGVLLLLVHPIYLLDMFVLSSTLVVLVFKVREPMLIVGLRGFRMLHFFENSVLGYEIRYHLWRIIGHVIWSQRFQLAIVAYFGLMWLFIIAFLVYFAEAPRNKQFRSVINSFWFTLSSFTTVGYGDVTPVSTAGKVVTSIGIIIGVSIFALPGGVIGAGLALKVEEDSSKPLNLRQNLAASMVQDAWKVFRARRLLDSNKRVVIQRKWSGESQMHFSEKAHSLEPSFSLHVVHFVFFLRFLVAKRKFKFAMYLCDSSTFYETYTQNTLTYNEVIRNLQAHMARIEELTHNINHVVGAFAADPKADYSIRIKKNNAVKDAVQPIRKRPRGVRCWKCLQRRRF